MGILDCPSPINKLCRIDLIWIIDSYGTCHLIVKKLMEIDDVMCVNVLYRAAGSSMNRTWASPNSSSYRTILSVFVSVSIFVNSVSIHLCCSISVSRKYLCRSFNEFYLLHVTFHTLILQIRCVFFVRMTNSIITVSVKWVYHSECLSCLILKQSCESCTSCQMTNSGNLTGIIRIICDYVHHFTLRCWYINSL